MRTWKRRHAQWTVVFNANLALEPGDSQRKTASQLRKDLKAWEAAQDANIKVDLGSPAAYMVRVHFFWSTSQFF